MKFLLIDHDTTRSELIARRLRLRGLESETATSYLYALTMLEWERSEMVVTWPGAIDGMSGEEFCATIKQDPALREILTILVDTPDVRTAGQSSRFDLVIQEENVDALAARLARVAKGELAESPSSRATVRSEPSAPRQVAPSKPEAPAAPPQSFSTRSVPTLRKEKRSVPTLRKEKKEAPSPGEHVRLSGFLELLEVFSLALKSGRFVIQSGPENGPVFVVLDNGKMVHVVFGGLEGAPAFRRLVSDMQRQPEISYRFETLERWQLSTLPRSINHSERQRLLEMAAKKEDFETQEIEPVKRTGLEGGP